MNHQLSAVKFYNAILAATLLLGLSLDSHAQGSRKPISITFLIDVSVSQEHTISRTRKTAREFIGPILTSSDNKAAVVTFAGQPSIKQSLTGDPTQIDSVLQKMKFEPPPGYIGGGVMVGSTPPTKPALALGLTAIWDAVWFTCEKIFVQPEKERTQAIILVTDGQDINSQRKMEDAIARAVQMNIIVYAIGVGEKQAVRHYADRLENLSAKTGGKAFYPRSEEDMRTVFGQIKQHLRAL